jgi:hypothetical protein
MDRALIRSRHCVLPAPSKRPVTGPSCRAHRGVCASLALPAAGTAARGRRRLRHDADFDMLISTCGRAPDLRLCPVLLGPRLSAVHSAFTRRSGRAPGLRLSLVRLPPGRPHRPALTGERADPATTLRSSGPPWSGGVPPRTPGACCRPVACLVTRLPPTRLIVRFHRMKCSHAPAVRTPSSPRSVRSRSTGISTRASTWVHLPVAVRHGVGLRPEGHAVHERLLAEILKRGPAVEIPRRTKCRRRKKTRRPARFMRPADAACRPPASARSPDGGRSAPPVIRSQTFDDFPTDYGLGDPQNWSAGRPLSGLRTAAKFSALGASA